MSPNPAASNKRYSQNDEQDYILNYFQEREGKFLDIGGFDPILLSNTRCLVERGWSGVYVEPSPLCMANFRTEYEQNPKIQLVEKAIALQTGTMEFYESSGDAVSTFDLKHKQKWSSKVQFTPIQVQTMTMKDLMDEYGHDVTCLSLDVEAMNYLLFLEIPAWFWDQCQFAVIEHDNYYREIVRILSGFGFSKLGQNAENVIMGKI